MARIDKTCNRFL